MGVPFIKMNGLGNDFVVLDARSDRLPLTPETAARIADRTDGIGCDQVILLERGEAPADIFMRIYNKDGGEVDACGNATRCVALLLDKEAKAAGRQPEKRWVIETNAGFLKATINRDEKGAAEITVNMGRPKFDWDAIPLAERMDTRLLDIRLGPLEAPVLIGPSAVNVGNPHCIFFVEDVTRHNLEQFGPLIEGHPLFPERTNVEVAQILEPGLIRVRVWERGVGITKACGTGACAVLPAAVRKGLSGREAVIRLDGGDLKIEWRADNDHIYMTGPAGFDFEGELNEGYFSKA